MHDTNLEDRLRSVLRSEGDGISLTITTDELERRLALRRRARNGRRVSLMAAGLATLAVGTMFVLSNGWLRGPSVATDPSPSPTASAAPSPSPSPDAVVTPSPVASVDPLAALPVLVQDPLSLDVYMTEDPGDPSNDDPTLTHRDFDGVHMEAREAGVKLVCIGSDATFTWGTYPETTNVASEAVTCDGTVQSFRIDLSAHQPMLGQTLVVSATPRTAFRLLVETFGDMNDPVPTALPSFATPRGTVLTDVARTEGVPGDGELVAMQAGTVPPRGGYLVAMVCLGQGTARWSIGDVGDLDFVAAGEVDCDGAAIAFEPSEGVPPGETQVWVRSDPANTWHIIVTDPIGDAPSWIAPQLVMWAASDMEGAGAAGLSRCTSHGDSGDSCAGVWSARDGAAQVIVPSHSEVTVRIQDGWRMNQARITARERDKVRLDALGSDPEVDVAYFPDGGDSITILLTGLKNGEWIVRVSLNAEKGSDTFGGYYDIPVIVGG